MFIDMLDMMAMICNGSQLRHCIKGGPVASGQVSGTQVAGWPGGGQAARRWPGGQESGREPEEECRLVGPPSGRHVEPLGGRGAGRKCRTGLGSGDLVVRRL